MIEQQRAREIALMVRDFGDDVPPVLSGSERDLAQRMVNYVESVECSCSDNPDDDEDMLCWYSRNDEGQINFLASLR